MTQPYPIDFDSLEAGEVIDRATIERLLGPFETEQHRALQVFWLQQKIEQQTDFTVVQRKGDLQVCTHEEAVEVNTRRRSSGLTKILKSHRKLHEIDHRSIDDPNTLSRLERERMKSSVLLTHLRSARAEIRALPTQRRIPLGKSNAEEGSGSNRRGRAVAAALGDPE